ncbi:MAG TPA: hypothetical protein VFS08_07255 [Gemmatimonadaceae bacterium]|nr:hypothetical protein [Gemmatimonadaceae bacterium]
MTSRDWDKELAAIDKQLASISDEELVAPAPARPGAAPPSARGTPPTAGVAPAPPRSGGPPAAVALPPGMTATSTVPGWRRRLAVGGKALLALALGVVAAPGVWPYGWRCGSELAVYLAVVGAAVLSGLWAARSSWRHRSGLAHTLSLLLVLWGLGLAAWQVLPRTGLALPTMDRPGIWACQ